MSGNSRRWRSMRCALGALAFAACVATPAHAKGHKPRRVAPGNCTIVDAYMAQPATQSLGSDAPADAAVAAEAMRKLPAAPLAGPVALPVPSTMVAAASFRDRTSLNSRLKSIKRLMFVRLWDTPKVSVYVGVNRAGVAGLHFQQQDPDAELAARALTVDDAPLRSVPLTSP